jgi:anti-sigma factor RsiW
MYNYSPEELIQYLYNETSPTTTAAIEQALKQDWTLREKLAVLKTSMERLNSITQSPRTETILAILKYAAKPQTVSTN